MGTFDYIVCEYPLPDGFDPSGHEWQTKDTEEQYLETYVIGHDGFLRYGGDIIQFHGALRFYTGNVSASCPIGVVTDDDQPPWWREYVALYDHGKLLKIEGGLRNDPYGGRPLITLEQFWAWKPDRGV